MKYSESGVSVEKANILTGMIKNAISSSNIGMFAGLYSHPVLPGHYLVGCADGVGTKVIPLLERNMIETIAIDLIAMNLNDMICTGASPLFFLDYIATHTLDVEITSQFIKCLQSTLNKYNCLLLGGETAELKDLITPGLFDVSGFAVGLVEKNKVLSKDNVENDDIVVGLKSSGPHSNGFTLIRKLYDQNLLNNDDMLEALQPTIIYVNEILKLACDKNIKVCANITGGGVAENLERTVPDNLCAEINLKSIPQIPLFNKLESIIGKEEAFKIFNMGIGMCLICTPAMLENVMTICGIYDPFVLGKIVKNNSAQRVIFKDK